MDNYKSEGWVWTQSYVNWAPLVLEPAEPEVTDLTEAQKVLAEIMSKC